MITVLLDTNCLLIPHQHGIDVFAEIERLVPEEHKVVTLSTVITELEGLVDSSHDGVSAKVGLKLAKEKGVEVIPSEGPVDDALVGFARAQRAIVCTNDAALRARIAKAGAQTMVMRGRKRLLRS
jgi:rRNA-processing protein FCF1